MTKMIKLSLAAAVAVSALTTTATAGSLENAIKDTTISGKATIGYNYENDKSGAVNNSSNETEYDFDATLTTKVNDTISFTTGFEADHDVVNRDNTTNATALESSSDYITLTKLYFTAKTDVATVMVGKQKQPTPFLDDERGDGVVALVPAGPVTVAAGHFTGLLAEQDITALAVIGSVGPVNASAWYLNVSEGNELDGNGWDGYTLNLTTKAGPVNIDFTHSALEQSAEAGVSTDDESLTKLIVSGKVADVNLVAGYGFTNDTNDDTRDHGVDLTSDDDAKTNFVLDQIALDTYNDASAFLIGASMTFGQTTVGASYVTATVDGQNGAADTDAEELDLTVAYAMSKNFSITGLYSTFEVEQSGLKSTDNDKMELSLNYKF